MKQSAKLPHDELLIEGLRRGGENERRQLLIESAWMGSTHRKGYGEVPRALKKELALRDNFHARRETASALANVKAWILINHAEDCIGATKSPQALGLFFTKNVIHQLVNLGRGREDSLHIRDVLFNYADTSLYFIVKTFDKPSSLVDEVWREAEFALAALYACVCLDRERSIYLVDKLDCLYRESCGNHPVLSRHLRYVQALTESADEPCSQWGIEEALMETIGASLYVQHVDPYWQSKLFKLWVDYNRNPLQQTKSLNKLPINTDAILELAYKRLGATEYNSEQLVLHHAAWIFVSLMLSMHSKKYSSFTKNEQLHARLKQRIKNISHRNFPVIQKALEAIEKRLLGK